jgi:flavin reductase (DIM6/NTAB) family NADH-FMN oxidoreductase RutF
MKIPLEQSVRLISPRPTFLITTINENGMVNAAPYSWIYPISFNPPLIGIGIGSKKKHTFQNIEKTKEFVLNVVSEDFAQKAINCEARHEPGENLLSQNNLTTTPSELVKPPRIEESPIILECRLKKIIAIENSDHVMVIGEIVLAESTGGLDEIKPLLHDQGNKFRSLGKEIILKRKR